jgi:hypothetical protein
MKKEKRNYKKSFSKAQVEILGLVFIVLIVTVAMLIYITFSVKEELNPQDDVFQKYTDVETSFSFIKVFLDTSVCGTKIQELIKDCATTKRIRCGYNTSCQVVNATLVQIKNQTLDVWGKDYGIFIKYSSVDNLTYFTGNCNPTKKVLGSTSPGVYYIPLNPGEVKFTMNICEN